jgi:hypothetical protein
MHRHDVFAFVPPLLLRRRARRPAFRPSRGVHMKPSEKKERKFSNTLECRMQNSCIRHVVVVSFLFPCGSNIRPDHRARLGELLDSSHPSCWSLCYKTCAAWALSRELRFSLTSFFLLHIFQKAKDLHWLGIGYHRGGQSRYCAHFLARRNCKKLVR